MLRTATAIAVTLLGTLAPATAYAEPPAPPPLTVEIQESDMAGRVLATLDGMTLYTYDAEANGTVVCVDTCADLHPPFAYHDGDPLALPPGLIGTLGTVPRPDGSLQVTYDGFPMYTSAYDSQPGDAFGADLHWQVAEPHDAPQSD
ncbi:MAG: hypothetical protein HOV77_17460 [Hamadaea sp.]|uniref:COG4315 family predicted lipoprotein n=1 Tax=Hamadaea sp. TaxID=2024425 RepID=UPI0018360D0F|nr:hypothetical protein [Hamadaea sp.]NUT20971.1 hypothetical protein [Hamadaea sp.]